MTYKQRHSKSSFPFKSPLEKETPNVKGLKYKPKTSKIKVGGFGEGGGTSGSTRKMIFGGEYGVKGKLGSISLKPSVISEKGKHHKFTKGDVKLGVNINIEPLYKGVKKLFKRK